MSSRTKNTKRNIIASYAYILINYIFQFISRSIILHFLGEEYLGLSSLFSSILLFLNMAELGFAGSIVYNMYKPIADEDEEKVCALLNYYKHVYRKIGTIILIIGVAIVPLIPYLIKDSYPKDLNVYFLYILYLANTVISYFLFAYKSSLLEATQRMDYVKIAYIIVTLVQYPLQFLSIIAFRNYYLFVGIMVVCSGAKNIVAALFANKYYPMYICKGSVSENDKRSIISRVKGLMIGSISTATSTLDSVVISSIVGLAAVAKYNNYIIIMGGVGSVITMIRRAMQSSVGNSVAKETVEKNYNDLLLWQFMFSFIASWCVSCMFVLYQPFMKLWMGGEMLLPIYDVIMICAIFNIGIVQHSYYLYLSASGLWWELRWAYVFEIIANLALNIVLGMLFGISGVIFSSLFVTVVSGLIWQCKIILNEYFSRGVKGFLLKELVYFLVSIVVTCVNYFILSHVNALDNGVFGLIIMAFISGCLSLIMLILIYLRTPMFKRALSFIRVAIKA